VQTGGLNAEPEFFISLRRVTVATRHPLRSARFVRDFLDHREHFFINTFHMDIDAYRVEPQVSLIFQLSIVNIKVARLKELVVKPDSHTIAVD
jgi:hypothetical protein